MSERSRILGRGLQQDKGTLSFDPSPELLLWKEVSFPEKQPTQPPGNDYFGITAELVSFLMTTFQIHNYLGPANTDLMQHETWFTDSRKQVCCEDLDRITEFTENFLARTVRSDAGPQLRVLLEGLPSVPLSRFCESIRKRARREEIQLFYAFLTPDADGLWTAGNVIHAPSDLTKGEAMRGFLKRVHLLETKLFFGPENHVKKLVVQEFHVGRGVARYPPVAVTLLDHSTHRQSPSLICEFRYDGPVLDRLQRARDDKEIYWVEKSGTGPPPPTVG